MFLKGSREHSSQEKPGRAVQQDEGIYKGGDEKIFLLTWEEVGFIWGMKKGAIKALASNILEGRTL